jgi:exosortase/archaeosortase family protein
VPAHIEGIFISTPTGLFRVAEACSGVRFLVAMAALAALAANLCFRSWQRRLLFVAAALAIAVLANGVRAFGTIYLAYRTNNEVAVGVDHLVYGWLFFAIVIALIMAGAWRFFDRAPNARWFDPADLQAPGTEAGRTARAVQIAAIAAALAAVAPLWTGAVAAAGTRAVPDSPLPAVPGWTRLPAGTEWQPHYTGADRVQLGRYRNAAGQQVDLAFVVFAGRATGASWSATARARPMKRAPGPGPATLRRRRTARRNGSDRTARFARWRASTGSATSSPEARPG